MPTEPYLGYMPEINSGRFEAGPGPYTWIAAGEAWLAMAADVLAMGAASAGQTLSVASTLQGLTSAAMAGTSPPFFAWLAEAAATAALHAAACEAVALSYASTRADIIPLVMVNQNRISEMVAEATNFFGVNTGVIIELNREYAQFWGQDGGAMMSYDSAVTSATVLKPIPPPPIISNAPGAVASLAEATADSASQAAQGAVMDSTMQAVSSNPLGQGSQGGDAMGSMTGIMGSMMSMPGSLLGSVGSLPQSLMSPVQSAISPLMSTMSQFAKPNMTGLDRLTGYSPMMGGAFASVGSGAHGGLPLGEFSNASAGGPGVQLASKPGEYGGQLNGGLAPMGGVAPLMNAGAMKSVPMAPAGGGPGGAPMGGGMGAGHGAGGLDLKKSKSRPVIEAHNVTKPDLHVKADSKTIKSMFS